jgi:hypothetical protein
MAVCIVLSRWLIRIRNNYEQHIYRYPPSLSFPTLSVPDEGYSRNVSCALKVRSTLLYPANLYPEVIRYPHQKWSAILILGSSFRWVMWPIFSNVSAEKRTIWFMIHQHIESLVTDYGWFDDALIWFLVYDATFSNIWAISWRPALSSGHFILPVYGLLYIYVAKIDGN